MYLYCPKCEFKTILSSEIYEHIREHEKVEDAAQAVDEAWERNRGI